MKKCSFQVLLENVTTWLLSMKWKKNDLFKFVTIFNERYDLLYIVVVQSRRCALILICDYLQDNIKVKWQKSTYAKTVFWSETSIYYIFFWINSLHVSFKKKLNINFFFHTQNWTPCRINKNKSRRKTF